MSNPHLRPPYSFRFIAAFSVSALLLIAPLHAAEPIISYVDHSASGNIDGSSWADAFTSLQDALTAGTPPDEIWVAEGTYYPDEGSGQSNDDRNATFVLIDGVEIYGGFPNGGSPFADRNPGTHLTILSGDLAKDDGPNFANNAENAYHVLTADGASASTTLDGFAITAGNAIGPDSFGYGGGLYCSNTAQPTITNCSFMRNSAEDGGGIYNTSSSPTFKNCSLSGNQSIGHHGGGGMHNESSSPTLINCAFLGNTARRFGGGMFNDNSSPLLTNCTLSGNWAEDGGGGIFNASTSLTLTNCIIWNNGGRSGIGSANASVDNVSSSPTYSHCLVQGLDLTGNGNLDGTSGTNNPRFRSPVKPTYNAAFGLTPTTSGDLRLLAGSPALDIGDDSANATLTDLGGSPRVQNNQIDLGAFEGITEPLVFHVDHTASGDNGGSSWVNAFTTLQDALTDEARPSQIWVAQGTYYPDEGTGQTNDARGTSFALIDGVEIYGGFPTGGSPFAIRDPGTHPTILSGDLAKDDGPDFANNAENSYNVLTAIGVSNSTILDGFSITAGNANGSTQFFAAYGGGLYCSHGARPTVRDCSFWGNSAKEGGAIYNTLSSSPTLTSCFFFANSASSKGGGIFNNNESTPTLTHCSFSGNTAQRGGGLFNDDSSPTFIDCSFSANSASSSGGGTYNLRSKSTLTDCSFSSNSASASGGGIYNDDSSATLTNCSISGNSAGASGGGIFSNRDSVSRLTNCSLSGNSASESGGGIYTSESNADLTNCSLSGNSAFLGGGICGDFFYLDDLGRLVRPSLRNGIFWNNRDSSGIGTANSSITREGGPSPIYSHCLVQGLNPAGTGNLNGTNPLNNPRFAIPVDPTSAPTTDGDLRLLAGSPALDVGEDSANSTTTDLAGNPRKAGTIDLGALEGEINDPALFWNTDFDLDGHAYGIEIATGRNPETPNPAPLPSFTTDINGLPTLGFPRATTPPADYILKVMRSPDLSPDSFTEIFRITPTTSGSNTETGNTFSLMNDIITLSDENPPPGSAFYRLEVEYLAPSS